MLASSSDEEEADDVVGGDEHTQELLTIYKRGEQLARWQIHRAFLLRFIRQVLHFLLCQKLPRRNNKKMTKGEREIADVCVRCAVYSLSV